jgi:DNA transformation protein
MEREDLEDLFAPFARVRLKRMFSGHGVYVEDACIALAVAGGLWLKTDAAMVPALQEAGSRPFRYTKKQTGKEVTASAFWSMPDEAFDDEDALKKWCAPALVAARRTAAEKAAKKIRAAEKAAKKLAADQKDAQTAKTAKKPKAIGKATEKAKTSKKGVRSRTGNATK